VKTRCPKCDTRYDIDADALLEAGGLARCFRCGGVFDALAEEVASKAARDAAAGHPAVRLNAQSEVPSRRSEPEELPFDVPDDLEPLQPSDEPPLDVLESLREKKSWRGFFYTLLALPLAAGLALQLAWQHRLELLDRYPQLQPVCQYIECRPGVVRAPDKFTIVQRDIRAATDKPEALTLSARFRNDADVAQRLPDIQLSLLDNNGTVLIRRRIAPGEYMFTAASNERLIAPDEVITITVDFADPGHLATGFTIDFL